MLFNSIHFLVFFPIVLLLYFILPKKAKNSWLLLASYYFYMSWNAKYALLILLSTVITYCSGIGMQKVIHRGFGPAKEAYWKKSIVAISFVSNLGILFYFKYFNFAFEALLQILNIFHIQYAPPRVDVILPVGISFYTLQALSYTMDVYRNDIEAEKNFIQYALFVSFFPQLVAGPIERSKNLLGQLAEPKKFNFDFFREGFLMMLWGYFLKLVLADRIAFFVDTVYYDIPEYPGYYLVVATVLFAFQIYCDFYGYSTIAMGAAKILGIQLMENFDAPFLSTSVGEFWRRWHISLNSWFKDYLYIPLGGSRKGKIRKHINKIIVFLVSGLWHGANFTYLAWGGINGLYEMIGELLMPIRNKLVQFFHLNRKSIGHKLAHVLFTFALFNFSLVFFRARSINEAITILQSIVTNRNPWILVDGSLYDCGLNRKNYWLMMYGIGILLFADYCKIRKIAIRKVVISQDAWFRWIFIAVSIAIIFTYGIWGPTYDAANFIYFQF